MSVILKVKVDNKDTLDCVRQSKERWFPVSEKLPDDGDFVQIFFPNVIKMSMYYTKYGFLEMIGDDFPCEVEYWRLPISPLGDLVTVCEEEE